MNVHFGENFTCDDHGEAHPCPKGCPETAAARRARLLGSVRDGAWLDAQTFPPVRYAVPGIIAEGFTILVGSPKVGKSWLTLAMLLAVSTGGKVFGRIPVRHGRTLYLALEDGDRRMQDRGRKLTASEALPELFHYVTTVHPHEAIALIEAFLERYSDTVLVVIDTLGKVMPPVLPNETTYQRDYRVGGKLKAIADSRPGLALVVNHHDRKAESDDFVDRVSGSNGLAGSADTIVVVSRQRVVPEGRISVVGRDVLEGEYAVIFDDGFWTLDGDGLADASRRLREREATAELGDLSLRVLELVNRKGSVRAADIADALGIEPKMAGTYLGRLYDAKRIVKAARGQYEPLPQTPVESVESVELSHMDSTLPTLSTDPQAGDLEDLPLWDDDKGWTHAQA